MSFIDEATAASYQRPPTHPSKMWTPGVDTEKGVAVQRTTDPARLQDWSELLESWSIDSTQFTVEDDRVEIRTWDANTPEGPQRFWYYKTRIVRKYTEPDLTDLIDEIRAHKPTKPAPAGDATLVVAASDWQLGKRDGAGTEGIVNRWLSVLDQLPSHIKQVRKAVPLGRLAFIGLGDLVEGCDGHYPEQTFTVEHDRRDQINIGRRLILKSLQQLAPMFPEVLVACVGGNHGENRRGGKRYTGPADNDDVAIFEQVSDVLAENPDRYGHVTFVIPRNDLTVLLDLGSYVAVTHGHVARRGSVWSAAKVWAWWEKQSHGMRAAGDATILLTGHYHHLSVTEQGPRTHIQVPALDESAWFAESAGLPTQQGCLTFVVDDAGWDHLRVIRP